MLYAGLGQLRKRDWLPSGVKRSELKRKETEKKRKRERERRRPTKQGQRVMNKPDTPFPRKAPISEDMSLPSWIPKLSNASYAMAHRPGLNGRKMSRINADPLVGLPSLTHRNYAAAETKGVDVKALKFRKRTELGHFSMYVRVFELDKVQDVEQVARNGQIPQEWAQLGGWPTAKGSPPDAFWRTLVADRGRVRMATFPISYLESATFMVRFMTKLCSTKTRVRWR
ncbi:hypothetical protein EJ02DRAFT_157591 [Clathrospora elynae]|uniref:Uncharacterized protein n=1 Tax=Clathrospora elynae TaxID=706981 RepID=A0A6A5T122_9PLEO|nr:hypothetical protein EJ02DRAFT_157591 [Clathrospora elynae]